MTLLAAHAASPILEEMARVFGGDRRDSVKGGRSAHQAKGRMMNRRTDEDAGGTVLAAGQQHGASSGTGGTVGQPNAEDSEELHHPRPTTPESEVEHQADQPGVTTELPGDEQ